MFADEDATLVEVNPMILSADGRVLALDGKVALDDNAAFRQPEHYDSFADDSSADPLEAAAKAKHLNYVKLDGEVGIIGNGAGLVMSTLDVVAYAGEPFGGVRPANFLDIGGGASAEVMANGLEIVLSDPAVRSVFVNVFGGITACDAVANGIVSAIGMLGDRGEQVGHPIVVRLDGNNAAEGRRHPGRSRASAWSSRWRRWTMRPGAPPSWRPRAPRREHEMAIFLTAQSRVIVQGITGSEGTQARRPDAARPARRSSAAPTRARRARRSSSTAPTVPVFGTVAEAMAATGADVSVIFVPPSVHQGRGDRGDRRPDPAGRGDHRGHPGARLRRVLGLRHRQRQRAPGSSARTAPASPRPASPTPASSRPTSPPRAASGWSPSRAR